MPAAGFHLSERRPFALWHFRSVASVRLSPSRCWHKSLFSTFTAPFRPFFWLQCLNSRSFSIAKTFVSSLREKATLVTAMILAAKILRWMFSYTFNCCILHYSFVCLYNCLGLDLDLDFPALLPFPANSCLNQERARSTSKSSRHSQLAIALNCPQSITELWTQRLLETAFALENSIQYSIWCNHVVYT